VLMPVPAQAVPVAFADAPMRTDSIAPCNAKTPRPFREAAFFGCDM